MNEEYDEEYSSEDEIVDYLCEVLDEIDRVSEEDKNIEIKHKGYRTFEDSGILTKNKGLTIRMKNKQEFQITVIESRR